MLDTKPGKTVACSLGAAWCAGVALFGVAPVWGMQVSSLLQEAERGADQNTPIFRLKLGHGVAVVLLGTLRI